MENEINDLEKQKEEQERKIKFERDRFLSQLVPFGYADVDATIETALDVGEDGDWAGEQIQNWCDDTGSQLKDVDPVYIVYNSILQTCRNEISEYTQKDIWNDLKEQIEVAGNYMCTSYDGTETAVKETLKLALKIPEDERSEKLKWFIEQLKNMY